MRRRAYTVSSPRVKGMCSERTYSVSNGKPLPRIVYVKAEPLVCQGPRGSSADRLRGLRAEELDRPAHVAPQIPAVYFVRAPEGRV